MGNPNLDTLKFEWATQSKNYFNSSPFLSEIFSSN